MSNDDIAYQLRPKKFIDRQLFVDLLGRLISVRGNEKYVYISMGGKHLIDHNAVYRRLGVPSLFAFDWDRRISKRQEFNRPIGGAVCQTMDSGSLAGELDMIFSKFSKKVTNCIVWLDFTDPNARRTQLQEMVEVLTKLRPYDILRITMNASLGSLEKNVHQWKDEGFDGPHPFRASVLRKQLDEFVPSKIDNIGENELPIVLARCIELAAAKASSELDETIIAPQLVTSYKDGQRMMTTTMILLPTGDHSSLDNTLKSWPFRAKSWDDVISIDAPDLSMREKLALDQSLDQTPSEMLKRLRFMPEKSREKSLEAIRSYKRLHRYYPAFHNIDA